MDTNYARNTRLVIELYDGKVFEGSFWSGNSQKMALKDVCEYPNKNVCASLYFFHKMDIESITILETNKEPAEIVTNEPPPPVNNLLLYKELEELAHKFKYISIVDSRFHSTIEHLSLFSEIAVFGFGSNYGRKSKISLLAMATMTEIFLFDIKMSGKRAFDLGLKHILESEKINKIVWNSKLFGDCLLHNYEVLLKNVFDVQVYDYYIRIKEKGIIPDEMRAFADIASIYLNIPESSIKSSELSHKHKQLIQRPLPEDIKLNSALQVVELYSLKQVLNKRASPKLHLIGEYYLDCMRKEDQSNCLSHLNSTVPSYVKELSSTLVNENN